MPVAAPILITSFRPWRAHQRSNSSDDLLTQLQRAGRLPANAILLRQITVNFELAPIQVIPQICLYQPKLIVCCGMAERRPYLSLERQGAHQGELRQTRLDLPALVRNTLHTQISDDAGSFVCNYLYYRLLDYVQQQALASQVLFIHVPVLTLHNWPVIEFDFLNILEHLNARIA
jgi:pyroglutamyl-peptidase